MRRPVAETLTELDASPETCRQVEQLLLQSEDWRCKRLPITERMGIATEKPLWLRYNPSFEYTLADLETMPSHAPAATSLKTASSLPAPLLHIAQRLSPCLKLLGGDNARVLDPAWQLQSDREAVRLLEPIETRALPRPGTVQYLPWGLSPETLREAAYFQPEVPSPSLQQVKNVQDRAFSVALEQSMGIALPGECIVSSEHELLHAIAQILGGFVIKHPFGVAGRERVSGRNGIEGLSSSSLGWCRKVLRRHSLIVEPWMQRVRDFGIQWYIPAQGEPILLGILELLNHPNGTYRGHRLGTNSSLDLTLKQSLVLVGLQVTRAVHKTGYFGPLGIDAFTHLDENGNEQLRPLVEINARLTMGMVALGAERLLPEGRTGHWLVTETGMTLLLDSIDG